MDVSNEKALAAGLTLTDPLTTARDTRAWSAAYPQKILFSREHEGEILAIVAPKPL